jgi:hypothetical protein
MSRIESSAAPHVVLPPREPLGARDLLWNGFRPPYSLPGRTPEQRAFAHRANLAHRRLDLEDFKRFLAEWVASARACRTLEELAAHPRAVDPIRELQPWEPGATTSENQDLAAVHGGFRHELADALREVERHRARLERRPVPLDVRLEATIGLEAGVRGGRVGAQASIPDGVVTASLGARRATLRCELEGAGRTRCSVQTAALTASTDGLEALEVARAAVSGSARRDGFGLAAGPAIRLGRSGLHVEAQAKVGLRVQLLDVETARRALSSEDFWTRKR